MVVPALVQEAKRKAIIEQAKRKISPHYE